MLFADPFAISPSGVLTYQSRFRAPADDRTQMTLVCSDRPGLLAQVAAVLREHRLRVHDARIATFGERVEDFFLLSDEQDAPLGGAQCDTLRAALLAALEAP